MKVIENSIFHGGMGDPYPTKKYTSPKIYPMSTQQNNKSPFFNQKIKNIPSNILPHCTDNIKFLIHIVKGEESPERRGCAKIRC